MKKQTSSCFGLICSKPRCVATPSM